MGFDIIRALAVGFFYYMITLFLAFLVTAFTQGIFPVIFIWWVCELFFVFLLTNYFYFRKKNNVKTVDGLYLGMFLVILTFIFDILFYVLFWGNDWQYFMDWMQVVKFILLILIAVFSALMYNGSYRTVYS